MKTIKDDTLSFLTQVFLYRGGARLSVGVLAGFTLEGKPELLPEPDFLGRIKDGMGKDTVFDPGMPKPHGEVLAAGKCFAPDGKPVPAMLPALRVGPVRKQLAVFGNRYWKHLAGMKTVISEPEPFIEMEISWKRAFGGPEYDANPDGAGMTGDPLPLPNVELPDRLIGAPGDRPAPAGFEPAGMSWPGRLKGLGTFDDAWVRNTWPAYPDDYNFLYYNRAPADQRIEGWLRGDEPVEADHLHPERAFIRSRLPGVRVRGFAVRTENGEEYFAEIDLRLETVWLLPNALTGVLIWRGVTTVADDEASDTPLLSAFIEPLDSRPETLEFYLEKVRMMQAGDAALAAPKVPKPEDDAAIKLPDLKAPKLPDVTAAAAVAGAAGMAATVLAGKEAIAEEGTAPVSSEAMKEQAAPVVPEAGAAPPDGALDAGGGPQPVVALSPGEIPKIAVPEFPPLDDLVGTTAFEKKAESMLKEVLKVPPDQPLFQEPPPLPDMTPEELQAHLESMSAQAESEYREFMERHGFDPDAPVELPDPPPELDRLLRIDPFPDDVTVEQLPLLLQAQADDFQKRFDDLAKEHNIDPHQPMDMREDIPFSTAGEFEQYLRNAGMDNEDMFEQLRKIDTLQNETHARMDQYLAVLGTSRAALAANEENERVERRAREDARDAKAQDLLRRMANGTAAEIIGTGMPASLPAPPLESPFPGADENETDEDFDDDLPEEEIVPRTKPPEREDVLNRLEGDELLAGVSLAGADLSETDLSNRDFRGTDFSGANLEKADFTQSDLTGANLSGAILTGAIFAGATLTKAVLAGVSASGATFAGIDLSSADLSSSDFTGADFTGANLSGAKLEHTACNEAKMAGATLERVSAPRAEFMGTDLSGVNLSGADLSGADFSAAVLEKADFTGATAASAWFSRANGSGAVFSNANLFNSRADQPATLPGADFTGANLKDARWQDTDFSRARFEGADLTNALFTRCRFEEADLSGVIAPNADFQKSAFIRAHAPRINLFKGSLRKADLAGADLSGANLYGVDFYQANVVRTRFDGAVMEGTLLAEWRPS